MDTKLFENYNQYLNEEVDIQKYIYTGINSFILFKDIVNKLKQKSNKYDYLITSDSDGDRVIEISGPNIDKFYSSEAKIRCDSILKNNKDKVLHFSYKDQFLHSNIYDIDQFVQNIINTLDNFDSTSEE